MTQDAAYAIFILFFGIPILAVLGELLVLFLPIYLVGLVLGGIILLFGWFLHRNKAL